MDNRNLAFRGILFALVLLLAPSLRAQLSADPYFLGYSSEPSMDAGGRNLLSLDRALCRQMDPSGGRGFVAAAWEAPLGCLLTMMVNHEINGHGGRAREFHLDPRYQFGFDLSAGTGIRKYPETCFQVGCLATSGVEADGITALRLQRDLFRPGGAEGSTVPALLFAKLDMSLYVFLCPALDSSDFSKEFTQGNDIAVWLVSRQAMRKGGNAVDLWDRQIPIDLTDPLLQKNLDAARVAAVWNALDPAAIFSVWQYVDGHLRQKNTRIEAPSLDLGGGYGLMAGIHGSLGPVDVSRYLDVYFKTPLGLVYGYVRDLDSSIDRTYGAGVGLHDLALSPWLKASLCVDQWHEPLALERRARPDACWNASGEIQVMFGRAAPRRLTLGLSIQGGWKTEGFLPGRPVDRGRYLGGGLLIAF